MKGVLLAVAVLGFTTMFQLGGERNYEEFVKLKGTTTQVRDRAFTSSTTDTTEAINLAQYKTVLYTLQSLDSASVIISYALSLDGSNWTSFTVQDSLKQNADGSVVKSIDFTSLALGAKYIRFRNKFSADAYPVGTTSAKYHAYILLKRF